jgi:hypothetical protein
MVPSSPERPRRFSKHPLSPTRARSSAPNTTDLSPPTRKRSVAPVACHYIAEIRYFASEDQSLSYGNENYHFLCDSSSEALQTKCFQKYKLNQTLGIPHVFQNLAPAPALPTHWDPETFLTVGSGPVVLTRPISNKAPGSLSMGIQHRGS